MEQEKASISNSEQDDSGSQVFSDDSEWEDSSSPTALCFGRVTPLPKRPACSSLLTDQLQKPPSAAAIAANVSAGGGEGVFGKDQRIRDKGIVGEDQRIRDKEMVLEDQRIRDKEMVLEDEIRKFIDNERENTGCPKRISNIGGSGRTAGFLFDWLNLYF